MWLGHIPVLSSPVTLTAYFQFVDTTGSAAAPSSPTYRVYEEITGTSILNGSLTALDGTNALGCFYVQVTVSSGNGFEDGKYYVIRGTGTVDGETPAGIHTFRCGPEPANIKQIDELATSGNNATLNLKQLNCVNSAGDALVAQSTGGNGNGMNIAGNGTGHGGFFKSGADAGSRALMIDGEGSADYALEVKGAASNSAALFNGANGSGGQLIVGDTSGRVLSATATGSVPAVDIFGGSATLGAVHIQGDTGATDAPGMTVFGGEGKPGLDVRAGTTGNAPGAIFTGRGNQPGVDYVGGTSGGDGQRATGGSGGHGANLIGGNSNGHGLRAIATGGNASGAFFQGFGGGVNGAGARFEGTPGSGDSPGAHFKGGLTNGAGITLEAQGTGRSVNAIAAGEPLSQNIEDQLVNPVLAAIAAIPAAPSVAAIADGVWDEILGTRAPGSAGRFLSDAFKIVRNRLKIDGVAFTMTVYDDDETTPIFVWNVKDSVGAPSTSPIFEREPA